MKTVTLSTRIDEAEAKIIDQLAKENGVDRATFLKQLLKKGLEDYTFTKAISYYRRGKISLSRAAEMANISIRDFIAQLPGMEVELNYDLEDLTVDLK
jgi:predicted HTH domain antitoxin